MPTVSVAALLRPGGVLRVGVGLCGLDERPLDGLRVLLVADVLRRVAEDLLGGQAHVVVVEDDTRAAEERSRLADSLWVRPPTARVSSPEGAENAVGGPLTVVLKSAQPHRGPTWSVPFTLRIGEVHVDGRSAGIAPALVADDPLAVRLALLRFSFADTALLSTARMRRAKETLQRWRFKVAGWADLPSAPPAGVEVMTDALTRDLDTSAVLRMLHRIELDPQPPSGSKFETFVGVDRVLALDLSHQVGKLRR